MLNVNEIPKTRRLFSLIFCDFSFFFLHIFIRCVKRTFWAQMAKKWLKHKIKKRMQPMVNMLKREKHRTKVDTAEHAPQLSMTNAAPNVLNPNMYYPEAQMPSICFGCVVHHNIYLALSSQLCLSWFRWALQHVYCCSVRFAPLRPALCMRARFQCARKREKRTIVIASPHCIAS